MPTQTFEFTAFTEADLLQNGSRDRFDFSNRTPAGTDRNAGDEHEIEYDVAAGVLSSNPPPVPAAAEAPVTQASEFVPATGDTFDLFF